MTTRRGLAPLLAGIVALATTATRAQPQALELPTPRLVPGGVAVDSFFRPSMNHNEVLPVVAWRQKMSARPSPLKSPVPATRQFRSDGGVSEPEPLRRLDASMCQMATAPVLS